MTKNVSTTYRELFATLFSSVAKYVFASSSAHAFFKSMFVSSFTVANFNCCFHVVYLSLKL
tara:strand:+ start:237 stop:419 length:183 start_codon:yes stop_codon:yes gene_type:complete